MSIDVFSIHCDALDGAALAGFKGVEVLNRPYELDVFFTVPVGTDVRGAVGERATLTADRADGRGALCWQGILAGVRLLHETAERALYRASLVPKLWILGQHVRSFVHTKKKIDAYVGDTLKDGGLPGGDFEFKTNGGAYPQEEFVCQYRESHLDFVHRWFEREGLYYYFDHPEGAGGAEKMVIVDDKAQHGPLLGDGHVRYFAAAGADGSAGECLRELHADFRLLPASVLVTDYNYANPAAPVAGEKAVASGGQGKIREYGYRVFTEGEAKRLAQVKAQSIACREMVLSASGTYLGLRAGYTFEVDEGPSDLPGKYLAIEVRHAGVVSGAAPMVMRYTGLDARETYRVDVVAIPADVQYRAPQSTAWPRIYGFENGTVDGPGESQYAQIDDQGRYLVRFKFDASDLPDGSTSTYLRMMQPHGGTTEGWHFPLRKGTEVMVSFQGGDPDRPVIAGVVPNAVTPSNVTNRNNRQNVLRSGGGNYMIMDDTEDAQYIDMVAPVADTSVHMGNPVKRAFSDFGDQTAHEIPVTYDVATAENAGFWIGGGWWEDIGKNKNVYVRGPVTLGYQTTHKLDIGGKSEENYHSVRITTIKSGRTDKVLGGGMIQEINGGYFQKISPAGKQEVSGNWYHQVGSENHDKYGTWKTTVEGEWTATIGGPWSATVSGPIVLASGGAVSVSSPSEINLIAPKVNLIAPEVNSMAASSLVEFFGSKNALGIHQFNATALNMSVDGVKRESVGMAFSLTGLKFEVVGASNNQAATELKKAAAAVRSGGIRVYNYALSKM